MAVKDNLSSSPKKVVLKFGQIGGVEVSSGNSGRTATGDAYLDITDLGLTKITFDFGSGEVGATVSGILYASKDYSSWSILYSKSLNNQGWVTGQEVNIEGYNYLRFYGAINFSSSTYSTSSRFRNVVIS